MDFIIKDKVIKLDKASLEGKKVVSVNSGYVANFIFDDEWDGLMKTVRFINDGEFVDVVLDHTSTCKIPRQVMKSGTLEVGVFAGDIQSTTPAKVSIIASILEEYGSPAPPTDDVYSQIMERLDDVVNSDYESLDNLPTINDVTLIGDLTGEELRLQDAMEEVTPTEVIDMWNNIMNEE